MIEKLKTELKRANDAFDKAHKNAPLGMNWDEYKSYFKKYEDNIDTASIAYRLVKIPTFKDIPKVGNRMSLVDFIDCCNGGGFIDYDGFGNYIKDDMMSDISIYPSDIKGGNIRDDFNEIIWFNR